MSKDVESFDIDFEAIHNKSNNVNDSSIITKTFNAIYNCIIDPEKGPYFAAKLVNGTSSQNLVAVIDGHIRQIECKIGQLEYNLEDYERKRKISKDNFFESRPRRRTYRKYVYNTRYLVIQYTLQETYYIARDFFGKLRK